MRARARIEQNILQNYLCGDSETMLKSTESLSTMSEGSNADNATVDVAERCVVNDKLTRVETMEIVELKKELKKRRLKITGEKKVLQDRLKAFIALEIEHGEDEKEEENEENEEEHDVFETPVEVDSKNAHISAFRDVPKSMSTFSGDDILGVKRWLSEFERVSDLRDWTDTQRVIYAKKLLRGSAKSFVENERCCTNWQRMKEMLNIQFEETVDVYEVHRDLLDRIKDEIGYRKNKDDPLVIVPKDMRTRIVQAIHERGHYNIIKTEQLVRKDFWFREIRQTVEKVVMKCSVCKLAEKKRSRRASNQEELLNTTEKEESPLDTYHVLHLGPLPSTKKDHEFIFAVVDDFTKFVWLYSTTRIGVTKVVSNLKRQSVDFGNPRIIISDEATAFMASDFREYCSAEGIQHIWGSAGIPWANDQVERLRRMLIPLMKRLTGRPSHEWYKHLNTVQKYLNATPTRSTNIAPFQLMFGTRIRMQDDLRIWRMIEEEWAAMFQEERTQVQAEARRRLAKIQHASRWGFCM